VCVPVILDGAVVPGDVEQVRPEQVDPRDGTRGVVGWLRVVDLVVARRVIPVLDVTVVVVTVVVVTVVVVTIVAVTIATIAVATAEKITRS